jgi:hypothetical protein
MSTGDKAETYVPYSVNNSVVDLISIRMDPHLFWLYGSRFD